MEQLLIFLLSIAFVCCSPANCVYHRQSRNVHLFNVSLSTCSIQGDFVEADERWCSRRRGGRKRKNFSVDMLMRKRVAPLNQESAVDDGVNYLRWLLSGGR